jgi:DNA polymerase
MSPMSPITLPNLAEPAPECARCPALVASRSRIVGGYGDHLARIVFVGEAPGRHGADRTGVPFCGDKSGRALQRILIALGLMLDSAPTDAPQLRCFVTNVVRCCPPANRTPTPAEQAACAPFLAAELDALDPQIIVPVGLVALRVVGLRYLGAAPAAIRGLHAVPLYAGERVIVPLIHPARIARAQIDAFVGVMRLVLEARSFK